MKIITILVLCLATLMMSCGGSQGDWVGTWEDWAAGDLVRFDKNGTIYNKFNSHWIQAGTYTLNRNEFVINTVGITRSGTWKLKGSTLTLYQDSEVISTLKRIN